MKRTKILKIKEYCEIGKLLTPELNVSDVSHENIVTKAGAPLYESTAAMPVTNKIVNAIIALPSNNEESKANLDSLTNVVTGFIDSLNVEKEVAFSIGNYFAGDYTSGKSCWDGESLCVSLYGAISDQVTTIATAVQILDALNLPKILIVFENSVMEITSNSKQTKPSQQTHVKRLCD